MKERRSFPRVEVRAKVNYAVNASAPLVNLSATGACIRNGEEFDRDVLIAIELKLPGIHAIDTIGRVVWCNPNNGGSFDAGIELRYIAREDRIALAGYCSARIVKQSVKAAG